MRPDKGREMMDLSDLTDDGDTIDLPDGKVMRLRFVPDESHSINDYDSDGRVEWARRNDRGSVRPECFDGSARIIHTDYPHDLWWQPPGKDIIGDTPWDAETMRRETNRIRDLVVFGFKGVILEVCEGKDFYGRPVVQDVASLWGIEWDADVADIVAELADEVLSVQA